MKTKKDIAGYEKVFQRAFSNYLVDTSEYWHGLLDGLILIMAITDVISGDEVHFLNKCIQYVKTELKER